MTTSSNPSAAFGKPSTCACCGKPVKKPVYSKRLDAWLGKDCMEDIRTVRSWLAMGADQEKIRADVLRDWPRSGERLLQLAK